MPNRARSFAFALLSGACTASVLLAVAALPGLNVTASAAGECLESPNLRTAQPGHWFYHSDRTLNRRCWFFQPSDTRSSDVGQQVAPANAPVAAAPVAVSPEPQQSLLSLFAPGLSQSYSPQQQPQQGVPQQYSIPEEPAESVKIASPKSSTAGKVSRRQAASVLASPQAPTTSGDASAGRQDQTQTVATGKAEKQPPLPSDVAERESLFQDFMKWQRERTVFGDRW